MNKIFVLPFGVLALAGCAATSTTTLSGAAPHAAVAIYDQKQVVRLPLRPAPTKTYDNTSFSRYEFKASGDGKAPLYGLLPLKVNGGNVASGVLLFPPALLLARGVYAHYDFDLDRGVVRYRERDADAWAEYRPEAADAERARGHIDASAPVAGAVR
ncbi:hypothetical protein ACPRNU_14485 [Chromobacterium vaccinii]|uniref:hypothetical protein n=1 Tax=Chromobacterium vaccinii TaxID=1108595 RepID=UPI003C7412BD